jgi:glycosyltransferase 2 family protein
MKRAALVGLVIGVPASAFFLWLAFREASFDEIWSTTKSANPLLVAAAVAAGLAVYGFQAARWRRIAGTERPELLGFVQMVLGAVACNNLVPGRLGELFRARWLAVAAPIPSGRALATVGLDRTCDVVTLFAFLVISLPAAASPAWVVRIVVGSTVLLLAVLVVLLAARSYSSRRERGRRERGRLRRIARDLIDELAQPIGRRRVARALAVSMLAWGSFAVAVALIAQALDIDLDPLDCLFVTAVVNLGVAIPSSPGFVGTYQWLGVASLGALDVPREQALAFSILLHASWYVPTTLVGGLLLLFRLDWGFRSHGRPSV